MPPSSRSPQPAKAILAVRDLPQAQVARDLGVSAAWLGRILNGRERPSEQFADRLSEYLGVPVEQLFADDPGEVIIRFVRTSRSKAGLPEVLADDATAAEVARLLKEAT